MRPRKEIARAVTPTLDALISSTKSFTTWRLKTWKGQDHDGGRLRVRKIVRLTDGVAASMVTAFFLLVAGFSWMGRWGRFTRTKALAES